VEEDEVCWSSGAEDDGRHEEEQEEDEFEQKQEEDDLEEMPLEELVRRVKAAQSSSTRVNDAWSEYCIEEGGGTQDPKRHDTHFLQLFLARLGQDLPAVPAVRATSEALHRRSGADWSGRDWPAACTRGKSNREGAWPKSTPRHSPNEDGDFAQLVSRVREAQKSSRTINEAWNSYCDVQGGGTRDPGRHNPGFLRQFLDSLDAKRGKEGRDGKGCNNGKGGKGGKEGKSGKDAKGCKDSKGGKDGKGGKGSKDQCRASSQPPNIKLTVGSLPVQPPWVVRKPETEVVCDSPHPPSELVEQEQQAQRSSKRTNEAWN